MNDSTTLWVALGIACVGAYLLKWAGMSLPQQVLDRPTARRAAALIPVALLAALVAVQVVASGTRLVLDARLAGLAFAVAALLLRAPFLVVVFGAAVVAALLRLA
ncbi:AzlD domain-containing protein [Nocardioides yefusunii]|uniref:AzlD domain-containing protein n=1 Tax=Nocardioides yefusunii TaxID=2500546 RepID=A0ABW1QWQ7_9ACTN|nr:AzlD domain-containing protein [Nocardioides yefusunii]